MSEQSQPNYYANIPADVRYAPIKANAKLLYAEITALCNKEGYCWASNSYFAKLYQVRPQSISDWVSELVRGGFVRIEVDQARGNLRKIFLAGDLLRKNVIPITQNRTHNTKKNITKNINTMSVSKTNTTKKKEQEDFIQELHLLLEGKRPLKALDDYRKQLQARLKTFSYEEIREATRNLSYDDYNMGREDRNPNKYATVEYILRDNKKIEKYLQSEGGSTPDPENRGKLKVDKESINWDEV